MEAKVRKHFRHQIPNGSNLEFDGLVRSIGSNEAASPRLLDRKQEAGSVLVLADRETRPNLPAKPMSSAWLERNTKAAFPICKARDVGCEIHQQDQGRRVMKPCDFIQGAHP